ncbi:CybS-domain-containing protein [Schizophyllum fasciatum]
MASQLVQRSLRAARAQQAVPRLARRTAATAPAASVRDKSSKELYTPENAIYIGTVNDPVDFPPPSRTHGSYHWAFERLLSAALIPLTAGAFVVNGSVVDGLLGLTLVVHSHIGFDSSRVDYLHPRKFPTLGPIVKWGLRAATAGVLVGVYQFNTNDIGLTELIAKVWHA